MKNILDFLRIPLVKFIGIIAILYFGFFSNKENPESLSNRLSKERVEQNLQEAKERSRFIASNLKTAQEIAKEKKLNPDIQNKVSLEDIEIGKGEGEVSCGSEVEISYSIFSENGTQIKNVSSEKLVIGSNLDEFLERNLYGMKQDGIRNIKVPREFMTNNIAINEMLRFYDSGIRYQVLMLNVVNNPNSKISCR
jgi:hypothetical protein